MVIITLHNKCTFNELGIVGGGIFSNRVKCLGV